MVWRPEAYLGRCVYASYERAMSISSYADNDDIAINAAFKLL